MSANADPAVPASPVALWPAAVLAEQLVADDPLRRALALGMALQPGAPIDACAAALAQAGLQAGDDAACAQMAGAAMGGLAPHARSAAVLDSLHHLLQGHLPLPGRTFAAHAFFRFQCLPDPAAESVCQLLTEPDANARKVALLAFSPFAERQASTIARHVAGLPPSHWTTEALLALARSAGDKSTAQRSVEAYITRSLAGMPLLPTGVAAYTALAQMNPAGPGLDALARIAASRDQAEASAAALEALAALGPTAQRVAPDLGLQLAQTDDPAHEEALCRGLTQIKARFRDLPVTRVVQRVREAPPRSVAAHCLLLCLYPRDFSGAAITVRGRHKDAPPALLPVLSQTHKALTGQALSDTPVGQGA